MKQQRSEIWSAVIWIVVYVVGASIADNMSAELRVQKAVTFPFLLLLSLIALFLMRKNRRSSEYYGLCRPAQPARRFLFYLPLALLASCNLWHGVKMNMPAGETLLYIGSMLCVGFLEELIFRGFLFRAMQKDSLKWAVVVSSVTFGIGHIVNLFNGSGAELISNLCQVFSAVAFGFMFVILFLRCGSLWPCVLCHGVLNSLSAFANENAFTPALEITHSAILSAIAIAYTLYLLKAIPAESKTE